MGLRGREGEWETENGKTLTDRCQEKNLLSRGQQGRLQPFRLFNGFCKSDLALHLCIMGHRSPLSIWGGPKAGGAGMRGCRGRRWFCASMEDNLMTVEGGSGCLKELSIPAALHRREVKAICPTSKTKDTHTHPHTHTQTFCPWPFKQMEVIHCAQLKHSSLT